MPTETPGPGFRGRAWPAFAAAILAALLAIAAVRPAAAHDMAVFMATAEIRRDGTFVVDVWVYRNLVAVGFGSKAPPVEVAGLPPGDETLRNEVRGMLHGFAVVFDGKEAPFAAELADPPSEVDFHLRLKGTIPHGARTVSLRSSPAVDYCGFAVRHEGGKDGIVEFRRYGLPTKPAALDEEFVPRSAVRTAAEFVGHGFTHILPRGLDHMLFVVGLFLLSTRLKPLLLQVSAFTVAHTVTLGLSVMGVFRLPPSVVEPLIAASIAYVAVENLCTEKIHAWRVGLVFGFGLLHGLGFAGALSQLGLPGGQKALALVSFNVGVELGQLAVLLTAWVVLALPFRAKPWYRRRIVLPLSAVIAAVGLWWAVTRVIGG